MRVFMLVSLIVVSSALAALAAPSGFVDTGSISCTAAAAVRIPVICGMLSIEVHNTSTTRVAVGDSTISDPGATGNSNSPTVCASGSGCTHNNTIIVDSRDLFCRGDVDTTVSYTAICATQP